MKRMDSNTESVNDTVKEFRLSEYQNSLKRDNTDISRFEQDEQTAGASFFVCDVSILLIKCKKPENKILQVLELMVLVCMIGIGAFIMVNGLMSVWVTNSRIKSKYPFSSFERRPLSLYLRSHSFYKRWRCRKPKTGKSFIKSCVLIDIIINSKILNLNINFHWVKNQNIIHQCPLFSECNGEEAHFYLLKSCKLSQSNSPASTVLSCCNCTWK